MQAVLGVILLLVSGVVLGWAQATHALPRLYRPRLVRGWGALWVLGLGLGLDALSVAVVWMAVGWVAGVAAIVAGIWVLPPAFQSFFRRRFSR